MHISRIVIRNFRNFGHLDVSLRKGVTCVVGENNSGKTNLLHAIRLAVDANLSSQYRKLQEHDVHSQADLVAPNQVVVSVEFQGYAQVINECALLSCCEVSRDVARVHYRLRPKAPIRDSIAAGTHVARPLSLAEDYRYELTGGGAADPAAVAWNEELGAQLPTGELQAFQVEYLPALRDVQHALRQSYDSPLGRFLSVSDITDDERASLVSIMRGANDEVARQPTIGAAASAITKAFSNTSGEAFAMSMKLGMAEPSFNSVVRSLRVLLSNASLQDFDPGRNGLGLNNILYISMLLEYFRRRIAGAKSAGELLLIEEPEAHLHPQLQRVLYTALANEPIQTIVTTHSTHISSHAPLESLVTLTCSDNATTSSCVSHKNAALNPDEIADLNRYLDATRSTLMFAKKVILVEGSSELFLFPILVRTVLNIDLDRHGITVVPIYGKHFAPYAKLFGPQGLKKHCAIIADADGDPTTLNGISEDATVSNSSLKDLQNQYVRVFCCPVTFERAVTIPATLPMLIAAIKECGYPEVLAEVQADYAILKNPVKSAEHPDALNRTRARILASAKRCGKARYAQIASKHAKLATDIPAYWRDAMMWLLPP